MAEEGGLEHDQREMALQGTPLEFLGQPSNCEITNLVSGHIFPP